MFSNLNVVELGEFITAPCCTKILSDWGANVIKIEHPDGGDKSRRHGPFPGEEEDPEKSGLYLFLNTNKKSITLNVKEPKGREILKDLLKDADFFVENNSPQLMRELGLDYASLKKEFPRLIMASITPFGQTGPYSGWKGHSLNISAISGIMMKTGSPEREPLEHAMSHCEFQTAIVGALSCTTALIARERTGKGQHCDIDASMAMVATQGVGNVRMYKKFGEITMRTGMHSSIGMYPWGIHPCKDGYFSMNTLIYDHWVKFWDVMGNPEWTKDPRFNPPEKTGYALAAYTEELDELLEKELKNYTKKELMEAAKKAQAAFYPAQTLGDMVDSDQSKFRNEVLEMDHPKAGKLKYPGAPAILSETPFALETPAPLLGQHNEEIFCLKMGNTKEDLSVLKQQGII